MVLEIRFIIYMICFNIIIILFDLFHLVSTSFLVITLESVLCFSILLIFCMDIFVKIHINVSYSVLVNYKNIYLYSRYLYMKTLNFYCIFLRNFIILLNFVLNFLIKIKILYVYLLLKFYYYFFNLIKFGKISKTNFVLNLFV